MKTLLKYQVGKQLDEIIRNKAQFIRRYGEFVIIKIGNKFYLVNYENLTICKEGIKKFKIFESGRLLLIDENDNCALVDISGKDIISFQEKYKKIIEISRECYIVAEELNGKLQYGVYSVNGTLLLDLQFENIKQVARNVYKVKIKGKNKKKIFSFFILDYNCIRWLYGKYKFSNIEALKIRDLYKVEAINNNGKLHKAYIYLNDDLEGVLFDKFIPIGKEMQCGYLINSREAYFIKSNSPKSKCSCVW